MSEQRMRWEEERLAVYQRECALLRLEVRQDLERARFTTDPLEYLSATGFQGLGGLGLLTKARETTMDTVGACAVEKPVTSTDDRLAFIAKQIQQSECESTIETLYQAMVHIARLGGRYY